MKGKWYVEVWFAMRRGRESPYRDVWGVVFDKRSIPLDVEIPLELVLRYSQKEDFAEKVLAWIAAESGLRLRGRLGQKIIVLTLAWEGGQSESPCERAPLFESTFVRPRRS